jgi:peroxiredoxin
MKHYFVIPYLTALFIIIVTAVVKLFSQQVILPWLMVLLATVPMMTFMMGIMVLQKARTREHLYPEMALALIAMFGALYGQHVVAILLCFVFGVIGIALYDFWYSKLERKPTNLNVGSVLPNVELANAEGAVIQTSQLFDKPVVWMFIRGNWCPLCVAQVKEMAESYRVLQERGVDVVIITPQPSEETQKLAKKFDAPMQFLVDKDFKAAKQLGLLHEGGVPAGMPGYGADTVYPTVLITDKGGKILYSNQTQNYRIRPEPADFIAVLDAV